MSTIQQEISSQTTFLEIQRAAELAGFSPRHFRRIIEKEKIRIVQIRRKFFIITRDFDQWKTAQASKQQ